MTKASLDHGSVWAGHFSPMFRRSRSDGVGVVWWWEELDWTDTGARVDREVSAQRPSDDT